MQGLLWCLHMYIDGFCPDYDYMYINPEAPPLAELVAWLEENPAAEGLRGSISDSPPLQTREAIMALMTTESVQYAPEALRHLITDPESPVQDLYRMDPPPPFDLLRLREALAAHPVPLEEYPEEERGRLAVGTAVAVMGRWVNRQPQVQRMELQGTTRSPNYEWHR
jgi:hypothetical protein